MLTRFRFRPNHATVVAYLALFVALGGGAYAATQLPKNSVGTKQLKNGAVTGRKVAKGTLTGANINSSTLGTVPNATNAVSATNALNATNAVNATNAAELGDQAPASFQARVSSTCASGSAIASIAAAGTVTCQPTNLSQMMGGNGQLPTANTHYLAGEGLTPGSPPTSETDGVGASALAGTAGDLDVNILTLQPTPLTFTLDVNDSPTALTCTIPANGGNCSDSTHTASIPAGALVDIKEAPGGVGATDTQVYFGWTERTSG